jgi:hypothetical protein
VIFPVDDLPCYVCISAEVILGSIWMFQPCMYTGLMFN